MGFGSGEEAEAAEVLFSPGGLNFDDASKGAGAKGVRGVMEGEGRAAAFGMLAVAVASLWRASVKPSLVSAETSWRAVTDRSLE